MNAKFEFDYIILLWFIERKIIGYLISMNMNKKIPIATQLIQKDLDFMHKNELHNRCINRIYTK